MPKDEPRLPTKKEMVEISCRPREISVGQVSMLALTEKEWGLLAHAATVALDLTERVKVLEGVLKDLLEIFDTAEEIVGSRDIEPHKWDAILEDAVNRARKALTPAPKEPAT